MRFILMSILIAINFSLIPSITAQSDPCSLSAVLSSFEAAALSGEIETWIQRYQNSECSNKIKSGVRLMAQGFNRMVSDEAELDLAMSFDGVSNLVEIPHSDALNLTTYTIEVWLKPAAIQQGWTEIMSKEQNIAGMRTYGIYLRPNELRVHTAFQEATCTSSYRTLDSSKSLGLSVWSHVAVTYDGASLKIYIDGELNQSAAIVSSVCQNEEPIRVGGGIQPFRYFNGQLGELRIWNYPRSEAEIREDMSRHLSGTEAGLVGYWPLDNADAGIAEDLAGDNDGIVYR